MAQEYSVRYCHMGRNATTDKKKRKELTQVLSVNAPFVHGESLSAFLNPFCSHGLSLYRGKTWQISNHKEECHETPEHVGCGDLVDDGGDR